MGVRTITETQAREKLGYSKTKFTRRLNNGTLGICDVGTNTDGELLFSQREVTALAKQLEKELQTA